MELLSFDDSEEGHGVKLVTPGIEIIDFRFCRSYMQNCELFIFDFKRSFVYRTNCAYIFF